MDDIATAGLKEALEAERAIEPAATFAARGKRCSRTRATAPVATLQTCDADSVRRRAARRLDHVRRRAAGRPGGPRRAAVRRAGRRSCSTRRWRRPGSTADESTSPTRSSISSSSSAASAASTTSPTRGEIEACRWWIEHERELIRPPVTVALGATAARSLVGKIVTISKVRGEPLAARRRQRMLGDRPSELPAPHSRPGARREERALFVRDLKRIKARAEELAR